MWNKFVLKSNNDETAAWISQLWEKEKVLVVSSLNESERGLKKRGAYREMIWILPEWTLLIAVLRFYTGLTVNER